MIRSTLERLYADPDFSRRPAVLHAAAVCQDGDGNLCVLRVEATDVPRSEDDRFVLGLARARADAIVTTAANLRAEPRLSHQLHPDPAVARQLRDWGRDQPARVYLLTAGGDVSPDHRIFSELPAPVLVTGYGGAAALRERGFAETQILLRESTSLRDTIAIARSESGTDTVLVEAGPRTAATLYHDNEGGMPTPAVDELMLSLCELEVPTSAIGPRLFSAAVAYRLLASRRRNKGGWSFHRVDRESIAAAL